MKHLLCIAALTGLLLPTPQAAAGTPRPLVALLAPLQAAVAPEAAQWTSVQQPVGIAIPDNWTPGLASDLDAKAVAGGDCRQIYGLSVSTSQAHSRPADLIVTLATVAANGAELHRTTLFDGPSLASGNPRAVRSTATSVFRSAAFHLATTQRPKVSSARFAGSGRLLR